MYALNLLFNPALSNYKTTPQRLNYVTDHMAIVPPFKSSHHLWNKFANIIKLNYFGHTKKVPILAKWKNLYCYLMILQPGPVFSLKVLNPYSVNIKIQGCIHLSQAVFSFIKIVTSGYAHILANTIGAILFVQCLLQIMRRKQRWIFAPFCYARNI